MQSARASFLGELESADNIKINSGIKNLFDAEKCISFCKQLVVLPDFRIVTKFQVLLYPDFLNSSIKIYNYYNYSYV